MDDEQHTEGDGYEVEMADGSGRKAGRPDDTREQRDYRAEDQAQGS